MLTNYVFALLVAIGVVSPFDSKFNCESSQNHSIMESLIKLKDDYNLNKRLTDEPALLFTTQLKFGVQQDIVIASTFHKATYAYNKDGLYTNFFFQGIDHSDLNSEKYSSEFDAEILYTKDMIVINPLESKEFYVISLKDIDVTYFTNIITSSHDVESKILHGDGIGEFGTQELNTNMLATPTCKCYEDGTSEVCHAGGAGSGDCTLSQGGNSCTVSCSVGYYACCKYGL